MSPVSPLSPETLYHRCTLDFLEFNTTADLPDRGDFIGQDRAVKALELGVSIQRKGYNIFALGQSGTGKSRFWIVPFAWMRHDVYKTHKRWLKKVGGVRPNNPNADHHTIEQYRIEPWRDRWDLLAAPA